MPKGFFDDAKVSIPCPTCGKKSPQPIGRLKHDPKLVCPLRGQAFQIEGGASFDKAEKAVDKFRRSLRDISKRLR
jgi:hypothetical protein